MTAGAQRDAARDSQIGWQREREREREREAGKPFDCGDVAYKRTQIIEK